MRWKGLALGLSTLRFGCHDTAILLFESTSFYGKVMK